MSDPTATGGALTPPPPVPAQSFPDTVVIGGAAGGIAFIPASTPLIGLNYYDGRFLRADDLNLERRAQRTYVEYSNRAAGPGVVHGFDLSLAEGGGKLKLTGGLAVDPQGRVLFLPGSVEAKVTDLVAAASKKTTPALTKASGPGAGFAPCEVATATDTVPTVAGSQLWLVCLAQAEGLCGNAEVFGRLCADACVTATDRPYVLDGVVLLLTPLSLDLPTSQAVTLTTVHLRSRVASAYFAQEWAAGGSLLSAAGLASAVWCHGAPATVGEVLPIGVLEWKGTGAGFLDEWTARRELMETPARRYWAGRMELRPWPVFLAQVLQFQCQLSEVLGAPPIPLGLPPEGCEEAHQLLGESTTMMGQLVELLKAASPVTTTETAPGSKSQVPDVEAFAKKVAAVVAAGGAGQPPRILVDGGIVELPAAGYLPVDPAATLSVLQQVQRFMGAGVDLRVCAVRRDQIAHELERAQHMDRISLLKGLDNPKTLEQVDILVPDGQAGEAAAGGVGLDLNGAFGFGSQPSIPSQGISAEAVADPSRLPFQGAARVDVHDGTIDLAAAAIATAEQGLPTLLSSVSGIFRGEDREASISKLAAVDFGRGEVSLDTAESVARAAEAQVRTQTATAAGVVNLPEGTGGQVVAVYATLSLGGNPFGQKTNQSVPFTATFDVVVPSETSAGHSLTLDGNLTIGTVTQMNAGVTVPVHVSGSFNDLGQEPQSLTLDLLLSQHRQSNTTSLTVTAQKLKWRVSANWSDSPTLSGAAFLALTDTVPVRQLIKAKGDEDESITDEQNAFRQFAMTALKALRLLHADDGWLDQATDTLFPQASSPTTEIRPTTDWVLFRRRRLEECAGDVPVSAPASKVPAWVLLTEDERSALDVATTLVSGLADTITEPSWQRIDLEFEPSAKTLRTPVPTVENLYKNAGGGERIQLLGYASNGPAGFNVLEGRAQTLLAALSEVAKLAPQSTGQPRGVVQVVTPPPSDLMVPGTEASMFLVTYPHVT